VTENYLEVGTVSDVPQSLQQSLTDLGAELGLRPTFKRRIALAGPNDILDVIMSAELWRLAVPWAVKSLVQGGLAFLGGQVAARLVTSRTDRKIDALTEKMDKLLEQVEQTGTAWGAGWELYFGLQGSNIERSRAVIAAPAAARNEAAKAVIALAAIGPTVEKIVSDFLGKYPPGEDGLERACVYGCPSLHDDGSASVALSLQHRFEYTQVTIIVSADGNVSISETGNLQ